MSPRPSYPHPNPPTSCCVRLPGCFGTPSLPSFPLPKKVIAGRYAETAVCPGPQRASLLCSSSSIIWSGLLITVPCTTRSPEKSTRRSRGLSSTATHTIALFFCCSVCYLFSLSLSGRQKHNRERERQREWTDRRRENGQTERMDRDRESKTETDSPPHIPIRWQGDLMVRETISKLEGHRFNSP